jgi:hypothetical protein
MRMKLMKEVREVCLKYLTNDYYGGIVAAQLEITGFMNSFALAHLFTLGGFGKCSSRETCFEMKTIKRGTLN